MARKDASLKDFQMQTLAFSNPATPEMAKYFGRNEVTWKDYLDITTALVIRYSSMRSNPETSSSPKTMELADSIFSSVITLREQGLIQNNPENLKTLDYFKARSQQLAEENEKLHKNLVTAYQVNEELQARLGEKAQVSRQVT
jgi:hypothetical protein